MKSTLPNPTSGYTGAAEGRIGVTTVLVPILNPGMAPDMISLAGMLVASNGEQALHGIFGTEPRVVVVSVVEVPPDQPLTTGLVMARSYRALLDFLPSEVETSGTRVRVDRIVKVSRDVASAIREAAEDEHADLLLLHWKGYARHSRKHAYGSTIDSILKNAPCDAALVRPEGFRESRRILLPVRGGPAAERALSIALALGKNLHLPVSVMHNVPLPQGEQGNGPNQAPSQVASREEEPYIVFNEHLKSAEESTLVAVERILTVGGEPTNALLNEVRPGDFVVMGTPPAASENGSRGSIALRVSQEKGPPLLILHTREEIDLASYKRRMNGHKPDRAWDDMPFEHWFVENTFHGDEFKDPDVFMDAKRRSGLTISVAVLTSNDAEHIHSVLFGLKRVLQDMHPIADQIAVIDAGSVDGTREIAASLGVDVYNCADILPEKGNLHGRGESWWKSLAVLKGDIIVWLDPRAQRFHPSTAMCLAGPLLRVSTIQLAKAYGQPYPAGNGHKGKSRLPGSPDYAPIDMSWGGFVMPQYGSEQPARIRVQALKPEDLSALSVSQISQLPPRTILQVLSPGVAGVIEPFGRDMAGRRSAMLNLPAFIGDNLEVGLLLSVAATYGTRAVAQVELRHAHPAPPPQPGLRYSMDLLQVLAKRLTNPEMVRCAEENAERLQRIAEGEGARPVAGAGGPVFEVRALGPIERPPIGRILE